MSDQRTALYLICNAHIDPVWLWEWEEGAAAALATFRSAADLCEEFDGFVFNHNEALLYQWVEEFEPELFERIRGLVRNGRWHIMGGWFLQPDCNLPSGESFARQIERGRRYFAEKFGARPTTAINFDPFGHSRGLVQLLSQAGYDSYLVCRPAPEFLDLPGNEIVWEGFDGSSVLVRRVPELYNTPLGKAREVLEERLAAGSDGETRIFLWGVGNHGGGPSRKDIRDLDAFAAETPDWEPVHATPEDYFAALAARRSSLPVWRKDLNRWAVGCYSSQVRVKQEHRALENELFLTERMASTAALNDLLPYPTDCFDEAERDLLISEFHDILPGSSVESVEAAALRQIGHGREILSRIRAKSFFALGAAEPAAEEGSYPVLVFNPHAFPVDAEIDCELQLADQNWSDRFTSFRVRDADGQEVPVQIEKESSNMPIDWRKRLVFRARLEPMRLNRFDAYPELVAAAPRPPEVPGEAVLRFETPAYTAEISRETGRLVRYRIGGRELLAEGGTCLEVVDDDEDSWATTVTRLGERIGTFEAMDPAASARFAGLRDHRTLAPVRIIEDGPVRSVVEALFAWGNSTACVHYLLPKEGSRLGFRLRVHWAERDRALKFRFPLAFEADRYRGQTAYGTHELPADGTEVAFQQWCSVGGAGGRTLTVHNDGVYAGDFRHGGPRVTLLRSPAYSAHHIGDRKILPGDRFSPRIDQGERRFSLWMDGGTPEHPAPPADKTALALNQKPFAVSFFPSGTGQSAKGPVSLDSRETILTAFRRMPNENGWMVRLFNPSAEPETVRLDLFDGEAAANVGIPAFKLRTLRLAGPPWRLEEVDLTGEVAERSSDPGKSIAPA